MKSLFLAGFVAVASGIAANAGVVQFEGFAPPGGITNVSPASPYSEAGLTFTPSDPNSAVFDANAPASFPGDSTSWFGFAGGNIITVTGGGPFDLNSLLVGPSSIGSGNTDVTFTGDLSGGGQLSLTFSGLTTATSETFSGWAGLSAFTISATTDSGIDNVDFSPASSTPEPASAMLLMAVAGVLGIRQYRRRRA